MLKNMKKYPSFLSSVMGKYKQKLGLFVIFSLLTSAIALSPVTRKVEAQGNGQALTVLSDIQEANSETGVVTARGNVRLYYPARGIQATSAQAQYFSRERRLILTGDVYVLQNGNTIRAESITYLIDESRFVATPQTNSQVESIYLVNDPEATNPNNNSNANPTPTVTPNVPTIPSENKPNL
jgi:lipopolysaccharide export system protein LptA